MIQRHASLACAIVFVLVAAGSGPADAQEAPSAIDERAMEITMRALQHLAAAQSFSFEEETAYDVLQADGRMLEYGSSRKVMVQRPDRFRTDSVSREEGQRRFVFDGDRVVLHSPAENVYAIAAFDGDINDMLDFVVEKLQTPVPAAEILDSDAPELIKPLIGAVAIVDVVTLEGTACYHISLRGQETDAQFWIQRDGDPIIHRLVLTYREEEGMPQYTAQFSDWRFDQTFPPGTFEFKPDASSERVPILIRQPREPGEEAGQ